METTKIWKRVFGLWPSRLTLGKAMQTSLSSCLIGAFVVLATFALGSCNFDDPDGLWDPMVWKAEVPVQKTDGVYAVSSTGGGFTFSCRNYSGPWMAGAVSNGEDYFPPFESDDCNYHVITTDWFRAEISGNKLQVVFEANDTKEERNLSLTVTAGDIFYTFYFKQFAKR